jgi:hypothetical protein
LPDSYTKYTNKIGLTNGGDFISKSNDVVLDFPYKDCVLEGGQDKEDQKRKEIFYNETIASDEISKMLAPKVFTNAKRYTKDGIEENITSDELIYGLVNSDIEDINSMKLIDLIKDSVLVERLNPTKKSIIEAIIKGDLSSVNINYICKSFKIFELKDEFIELLDDEDKLKELEGENLNKDFMEYVLNSSNIKTDTKVSLIETKINNHSDVIILKQYISSVLEITNLSSVWDRKQPLLDNGYKERIG